MLMNKSLKTLAFFALITLFSGTLTAQEYAKKVIFAEIGGPSFAYSINFQRSLGSEMSLNFPARIGLMYLPSFDGYDKNIIAAPFGIGMAKQLKNENMFLELKFNLVPTHYDRGLSGGNGGSQNIDYQATYYMGYSAGIGYKYQPIEGGFYFHANVLLNKNEYFASGNRDFDIWFGLGLGYCFMD